VRFVWAYIVGGVLVAISAAFPLFLLARELRMNKAEATSLRTTDTILLTLFGVAILAMTIRIVAG
jgi:Terpene cyclase DEP1